MQDPWGAVLPRRATLGVGPALTAASPTGHVVLLGDSVLDNAGYLGGRGPDVVAQLHARLPAGWRATLLARGGSVTLDVPQQLRQLPADASHLVISAGGNDAGRQEAVLGAPVRSVAEALAGIAGIRERFQRDYQAMLGPVLARRLPVAVCTIYDPRFADPARRSATVVALGAFNDIITREAFSRGLPVIDLRLVCAEDEDFAAPTGPSIRGGGKIAATIGQFATRHDPAARHSAIYPGDAR
jgi:lysophospholipase L1-like esterase